MIIDLHELLQEDNGNRSYHLQLEADVFETSTASYKIKDYDLQLSFHNEGKKHISSRCEGFVVLEIPCDRCLEPVDYKIDIDYFKILLGAAATFPGFEPEVQGVYKDSGKIVGEVLRK